MSASHETKLFEKALNEMTRKLQVLIVLQGLQLAGDTKVENWKKIDSLTKAGLTSEEIADILGMHPVWVRQLRQEAKKKSRGKKS